MNNSANRVRRARLHAKLTQENLADEIGVQRGAVTQREKADGSRPTISNLSQIAVAARVNFEWLATGRGPMRSDDPHHVPALVTSDFAHNELESRLLRAIRRMRSAHKREVIVQMIEGLTR